MDMPELHGHAAEEDICSKGVKYSAHFFGTETTALYLRWMKKAMGAVSDEDGNDLYC